MRSRMLRGERSSLHVVNDTFSPKTREQRTHTHPADTRPEDGDRRSEQRLKRFRSGKGESAHQSAPRIGSTLVAARCASSARAGLAELNRSRKRVIITVI